MISMIISFFIALTIGMIQNVFGQSVTKHHLFDTIPFLPDHYAKQVAAFGKQAVVTGKVIFLGNSIIEGGPWTTLLDDPSVINRGIGGDITYGVLKRLDDIVKRKPSKLFILIGINDIGKDIPDTIIADNCRKIIERLKQGSPQTKIYLQSILPVNPLVRRFPQQYNKADHIIRTNELLREVALTTNTIFVNLYPLFLDDQRHLKSKYTNDGLHLNRLAYERWVTYLKKLGYL